MVFTHISPSLSSLISAALAFVFLSSVSYSNVFLAIHHLHRPPSPPPPLPSLRAMARVILFRTPTPNDIYDATFSAAGYDTTSIQALADRLLPDELVPILAAGGREWEAAIITSRRAAEAWILAARRVGAERKRSKPTEASEVGGTSHTWLTANRISQRELGADGQNPGLPYPFGRQAPPLVRSSPRQASPKPTFPKQHRRP